MAPRVAPNVPGRKGFQPFYGERMTFTLRTPLADEHVALLDLATARTGRSRAAIVREALETHLPALLLRRPESDPTTTKPGLADRVPGKQVDDPDSDSVYSNR
jgi:predicted transcriptional regulator